MLSLAVLGSSASDAAQRAAQGSAARGEVDLLLPGSAATVSPSDVVCGEDVPEFAVEINTGDRRLDAGSSLCIYFATKDTPMFNRMDIEVECSDKEARFDVRQKRLTGFVRLLFLDVRREVPAQARIKVDLRIKKGQKTKPTGFAATEQLLWILWLPQQRGEPAFFEIPTEGGRRLPLEPIRLNGTVSSSAEPGDSIRLHIGVVDRAGNPAPGFEGGFKVQWSDGEIQEFDAGTLRSGFLSINRKAEEEGVLRAILTAEGLHASETNPCWVHPLGLLGGQRIWFGDEQVHTRRSDGSLSLPEMLRRIQSWGACDWVAITDHDRLHPFEQDEASWLRAFQFMEDFSSTDLVVLPGFEWTRPFVGRASPDGHRCVLASDFSTLLPIPRSTRSGTTSLAGLAETLSERGGEYVIIPHHLRHYIWWETPGLSAEQRDQAQPVAEVFARTHGNSESEQSDWRKIARIGGGQWPLKGVSWRAGLEAGARAGAVGGSDNHLGFGGFWLRPLGNAITAEEAKASFFQGMKADQVRRGTFTAVFSRENRADSLVRAIRDRRTYATSGPRIVLWFTAANEPVGSLSTHGSGPVKLAAEVCAEAPLVAIEFFRVTPGKTELVHRKEFERGSGIRDTRVSFVDTGSASSEPWRAYYCRVRQQGYGLPTREMPFSEERAISSPVWLERP